MHTDKSLLRLTDKSALKSLSEARQKEKSLFLLNVLR